MGKIIKSKIIVITLLFLAPITLNAAVYELTNTSYCSITNKLNVECGNTPSENSPLKLIIKNEGSNWIGIEISERNIFKLDLIKEDSNVIVFNYPVLYSGYATIMIFKKTGNYYITETFYSEIFSEQGIHIDYGNFKMIDKN